MPGIGVSLFLIAVGAILDFAVTVNGYDHGFDINTVGVILMIVGGVGLVLSLIAAIGWGWGWGGRSPRQHRTVVDDGRGHVMQREDVYR